MSQGKPGEKRNQIIILYIQLFANYFMNCDDLFDLLCKLLYNICYVKYFYKMVLQKYFIN